MQRPKLKRREIIWHDKDIAQIGNVGIYWQLSQWLRGGEPGWVYPPQYRICPTTLEGIFALVDETGWDGYQEQPRLLQNFYPSWDRAYQAARELLGSDGDR